MTPFAAAYDNIRLMRRKIRIELETAAQEECGALRDEAVMRAQYLTDDLMRALQDFADMGFEEEVSGLIATLDETVGLRRIN